jgi:hypothetical protein
VGDEPDYSGGSEGTEDQGNPAWSTFLEVIPEEFHEKVKPVLRNWDSGVQERFQKVHQEYEPWKPFVEGKVDPEHAQFALNLLNRLDTNPAEVRDAINEYYKLNAPVTPGPNSGQGQAEPPEEVDPYDTRFKTLEENNRVMAQILLSQREAEEATRADQELDSQLSSLRKTHGDFDERYVLALMQTGSSAEDAVKGYMDFRDREVGRRVPKPLIMGGASGGSLNQGIDPRKLDDKGTKDLVVQMLEAAASERRGR